MDQQSVTAIQTLIDNVTAIVTNDILGTVFAKHLKSVYAEINPHDLHVVETALNARTEKRLWHLVARTHLGTHQDSEAFKHAGCIFDTLPVFAVTTENSELYLLWVAPGLRGTQLGNKMIEALCQAIGPNFDDSQRHLLILQREID